MPISPCSIRSVIFGGVIVPASLAQRVDLDRYIDGPIDPSKLVGLLGTFSDDVFAVFIAAMGPDLKAWMPERSA